MTTVEKARSTAPRSALRYRPIPTGLESSGQATTRARTSRTDARVTSAPVAPDDVDREDEHLSRPHRTAPVRQTTRTNRYVPRAHRSVHPLLFIGLGILLMLILWVGVTQLLAWGTNEYNAIVYGSPRTYQIDAVVGQKDSPQRPTHFESINLHGLVMILEFPAGDSYQVRELATYTVPGPHPEQAVAILRFLDVNQQGKPDLVIDIDGIQSVLVNTGTSFRPPTPGEEQIILQALQHNQN